MLSAQRLLPVCAHARRRVLAPALDALFPPTCLSCDAGVSAYGTLCADCWRAITFISEPLCPVCGMPFDFALEAGNLCAACLRARPPFSRARAAMRYDEHSSRLIFRLKYHDDTRLAAVFAPWLAGAGRELLQSADALVPVPLHYWRFLGRRYNQAALLARALSRHTGLPLLPDALERVRATAQQTGLSARQRAKNVRGAFRVHPRRAHHIQGKSLVLLDDVFTTGATLRACTRALLAAGAAGVSVLTLAKRV